MILMTMRNIIVPFFFISFFFTKSVLQKLRSIVAMNENLKRQEQEFRAHCKVLKPSLAVHVWVHWVACGLNRSGQLKVTARFACLGQVNSPLIVRSSRPPTLSWLVKLCDPFWIISVTSIPYVLEFFRRLKTIWNDLSRTRFHLCLGI